MPVSAPRLMVAATASGVGKTTVVCGLLRALQRRGLRLRAAKCGPDYLDPMFHERVLGVPSCNLDLFLGGERQVVSLLAARSRSADLTLIEGVMGYYDGIASSDEASSYDLARVTETPVVLVVDARGRALSVAAEIAGFARFREPSQIAGVLLNRVSPGYAPTLKALVERECGLPVLGYVPQMDGATLESRHLGLVSAGEVADLQQRVDAVAARLEETVDLDALCELARRAPALCVENELTVEPCDGHPRIAVACDEVFNFVYPEALDVLARLGAEPVAFSPLADAGLPDGCCGIYLGGGYPELHASALSHNEAMRTALREAIAAGMPTIAECGGFMYLQQELEDEEGVSWPMVGAVAGRSFPRGRLGRFGYVTLTARCDSLLAHAGEQLRAHEFHYWESDGCGDAFRAQKPRSERGWDCVVATETLHAGFPHLYLAGNLGAARRFVDACAAFARGRGCA